MTQEDIIKKYMAVRYQHKGKDLSGLDCFQFIRSVYKDSGLEVLDFNDYAEDWASQGSNHFIENYAKQWEQVEKPQFMDVVLFHNKEGVTNHAGIYLSQQRFIHCCRAGVVLNFLYQPRFKNSITGFFRMRHDNN